MNSLISAPVADVLSRLFHEAQIADGPMICKMRADAAAGADPIVGVLEAEARDYRGLYHEAANNFLTITPSSGSSYISVPAPKMPATLLNSGHRSASLPSIWQAPSVTTTGAPSSAPN